MTWHAHSSRRAKAGAAAAVRRPWLRALPGERPTLGVSTSGAIRSQLRLGDGRFGPLGLAFGQAHLSRRYSLPPSPARTAASPALRTASMNRRRSWSPEIVHKIARAASPERDGSAVAYLVDRRRQPPAAGPAWHRTASERHRDVQVALVRRHACEDRIASLRSVRQKIGRTEVVGVERRIARVQSQGAVGERGARARAGPGRPVCVAKVAMSAELGLSCKARSYSADALGEVAPGRTWPPPAPRAPRRPADRGRSPPAASASTAATVAATSSAET